MQGTYFYQPGDLGYEKTVAQRLETWRSRDDEEKLEKRVRRYAEGEE